MSDELAALLERLQQDEAAWAKLAQASARLRAAGWPLRMEALASEALDALDPVVRPHFAQINAVIEGAGGALFPGAGVVLWLLLSLVEGPGLSVVEGFLRARRKSLEALS